MSVYYCNRVCQLVNWQQHKDTHAIGESLHAIKYAGDDKGRGLQLRELLNIILEKKLWIDGIRETRWRSGKNWQK